MTKIRVYELAKELGLENKELLDILHREKFAEVKSHSSTLEDEAAVLIRQLIAEQRKSAAAKVKPAAAKPHAPAKAHAEKPADEKVHAPAKAHADKPADEKAHAPAKVHAEKPAAEKAHAPAKTHAEKPADEKVHAPAKAHAEKPAAEKAHAPAKAHAEKAHAPAKAHAEKPVAEKAPAPVKPAPEKLAAVEKSVPPPPPPPVEKPVPPAVKPAAVPVPPPLAPGAGVVEADGKKFVVLKSPVIVRDLADTLGCKPNTLISELMMLSVFATINQSLDAKTVEKLCAKHGFVYDPTRAPVPKPVEPPPPAATPASGEKAKRKEEKRQRDEVKHEFGGGDHPRPPVVVFMGHVDHGKTSLQDYIRKTQVAAREAGGITQHIGASVVHHGNKSLTFLDTPGHEAFTAMRARGANATDIAVLVVAADDGVMPQTIEALNHARAAGVPIVVAMNKMDKPGVNPDKVLLGLQRQGVNPEDWGGEVGCCRVSAITGQGIPELLDRLLLESEMLELKANPSAPMEGLILEAQLETGMGPTCSVLVRNGTLRVGDILLCGEYYGRVKALIDDLGKRIKTAGPSTPVKIMGLNGVPNAGDKIIAVKDEREAKAIAEERGQEVRMSNLSFTRQTSLEDLFKQMEEDVKKELRIVLKADVRGSLEAIQGQISKLENEVAHKIRLNVIHGGVGEITENDVLLAAASDAVLLGFNVRVMPEVKRTSKAKGVDLRLYSIIYELLDDLENAILGKLDPETRETLLGRAEIVEVFQTPKAGKICGCRVVDGVVRVGTKAQVVRENELIYNGLIKSLRRFKDDVREVRQGFECGIRLDNFEDFEPGDIIKVFSVEKIAATLD
jgi:translation initiation factor IF-2